MVKELIHFGITKYVKIAFITGRGVFPIFTKIFINHPFSTSTGFMMTNFEAKSHNKKLESPKSHVVKGQMSAMLWHSEMMGKGVTQKSSF